MAEEPKAETKKVVDVLAGCKLPHGLNLDLRDQHGEILARVKLPGCAGYTLPNQDRKFVNPNTIHGDTITPVPKDHWDAWFKKNSNHAAIRSGAIYVASNMDDAVSQARNHEDENVGFNKIDPKKMGVKPLSTSDNPHQ